MSLSFNREDTGQVVIDAVAPAMPIFFGNKQQSSKKLCLCQIYWSLSFFHLLPQTNRPEGAEQAKNAEI